MRLETSMVNAHYSITAQKLRVVDRDPTKGRVQFPAHAGSDDYADIGKKGEGPLPPGAYHLYPRERPYYDHPAFVLDPVDDVPLNDLWDDRADKISRNAFRIHIALPDLPRRGSNGCIVIAAGDLDRLTAFCAATEVGPVETVRSPNPGGAPDDFFTGPLLGTLIVER